VLNLARGALLALTSVCACRAPSVPAAADWSYDVDFRDGELHVDANVGTDASALHVDDEARPFLRDVRSDHGHVHYRFLLAEAARALHDADNAESFGDALVSPASSWLLHPAGTARSLRVRVHGATLGGFPRGANGFEAHDTGLDDTPYFAFGSWRRHDVTIADSALTIGIAGPRDDVDVVVSAATLLAAYFRRFAPSALVLIVPADGGEVDGKTMGGGGASVLLRVGRNAAPETFRESWVTTHELVHLNLPSFGPPHQWLEEGIATYVEPIARARAGALPIDRVWRDLIEQAPKGLPARGDEGLEKTHTWGRTYWGGAIFCLAADVEIRKRTSNERSFDDVLRAIVATGAYVAQRWSVERFLATADAATGTSVVRDLYRRLALTPGSVDLDAMWRDLGVALGASGMSYDDHAPLAAIRRAITAR
jgi:hypothetical protein